MADSATMVDTSTRHPDGDGTRQIRRSRRLPGGRAVVGALLVTAAAVATFAAYLNATADPTTTYLVALETLDPGTRFDDIDQVTAVLGSATVDLPDPLNERAIPVDEIESLVGQVLVGPLGRGELVTRTAVVDDGGTAPSQTMSFAIPRTDAVGGALRPGELVDVLATFGSGDAAYTAYVASSVPLLGVTGLDGGSVEGSSDLILTIAVTEPVAVQALGHAVNTADVFVVRASEQQLEGAPAAYQSSMEALPPAEPAETGNGEAATDESPGDGSSEAADGDGSDDGSDELGDATDETSGEQEDG